MEKSEVTELFRGIFCHYTECSCCRLPQKMHGKKKKDDFLWESTACHRRCTLIQNIPLAKSAGNLFHQKPGQDDVMCFRYSNQSANTHLHMSTSVCFADKKITGFKKQRSPSDLLRSGNTYSLFLSVVSQQTSVWNRRSVYSGPDKHLCPA